MTFTRFTIKNFKCFNALQTLKFGVPREGFIGSGITYIVGANNSGKTTIIEGLAVKHNDKIKSSERTNGQDPEFILYDEGLIKRKCILIRPISHTIIEEPRLTDMERFEIISSRRHWQSGVGGGYSVIGQSLGDSHNLRDRQNNVQVASELKTIEADNEKYTEFISLVKRVIPEFTKFAVGYEDNEYIEYISGSGVRHKTELLGDGVVTVIRILLQLYVDKKNPIIIDEPELSLHPSAQKKLLKVIAEYSEKRQIIISTHSPYFIDWKYLQGGAAVNRVVKLGDRSTKVFSITDFTLYKSLLKSANWQQPYLLDEVAKEIFFSGDNILFLEGQEDVGLLREGYFSDKVNIFGYGVRGKDNFRFAFRFAEDLGYKKVGCIIDSDGTAGRIKLLLKREFPRYEVIKWNKADIRDKEVRTSSLKDGYFSVRGVKKDIADLDDFNQRIREVNRYFR